MSYPISLIQMPELVLEHIMEYLKFPSILVLRKVCHDLRDFIDVTKPSSRLTGIKVDVWHDYIRFNLSFPPARFPISITYVKNRRGCLVKFKNEKNVKKDFVTVFFKDFDIVLRHQKTVLEHITIDFKDVKSPIDGRVLKNVKKSLTSLNHPFQVKALHMGVNNHEELLTVLPYIDAKLLEFINIEENFRRYHYVLNLNKIGELEQWKQAKKLRIYGFQVSGLAENLEHFSDIVLGLQKVSVEELVVLKKIFVSSSTLTTITVHCSYNCTAVVMQGLIEAFGQPSLDNFRDSYLFFKLPNTQQILRIKLEEDLDIYFERIEQSDVPQNARILNR